MRSLRTAGLRRSVAIGTAVLLLSAAASSVRAQTPTPTPTPTATRPGQTTPAPPADASKTSMDIYGFMMLDSIFDFNRTTPIGSTSCGPTKLPAFMMSRRGRSLLRERPASRFGVKIHTDQLWRTENRVRVRVVRRRRRRRPDNVSFATCLGRAGTFRGQ